MHHRLKHPTFVKTLLDNPQRGAEIGVERGHFTEQMLMAFPALHLYAVDPWAARGDFADWPMAEIEADSHNRLARYAGRVTVLKMRSVDAAARVEDGSLDFVFIDAEHRYKAVLEDIAAWQPKVKPGGLLAGHDFSQKYPGVMQAVCEIFPGAEVDTYSRVWWVTC